MRLLVGLHQLGLGGSQLNALDLAREMAGRGHRVGVFGVHDGAEPGPLAQRARDLGLPLWTLRHPRERPRRGAPCRPAVAAALTAAARAHRADLLHVYEYPLILDAFHGPHRRLGTPLAATVYAMDVPRWLPADPPLVVGTRELVAQAAAFRPAPWLIEPPVDTDADDPSQVDGEGFRAAYGVTGADLALVVVSRLEPEMKAEGIRRTMAALPLLRDDRLRLLIVGDGPSAAQLRAEAGQVNRALGREAVTLTGALADPRPAYAAADIALGMGGSALRAMAFARPVIALGTGGFSRPVTPQSAGYFLHAGFYGIGAGDPGPEPLAAQLAALTADAGLRQRVGQWSRQFVLDRFGLKTAADTLTEVYAAALDMPAGALRRHRAALRIAAHRTAAELAPGGLRRRIRQVSPWP